MKRNYDDPVYKDWRKKVLARDGRKCQMPRCKHSKFLQVHHIKKWSSASALRFETNNGITLCARCNKEVNRNEHFYESLFLEIARKNSG
jgi:5-methylcytosine-specific restriction endonuclease McrA